MAPTMRGAIRRWRTRRRGSTAAGWARVKGTRALARSPRACPPQGPRRRGDHPGAGVPQAQAADESMIVVSEAYTARKLLQPPGVAATEYDVVRLECGIEIGDHLAHRLAPALFAEPLAAALADVILEGAAVLVGHVPDFGRLDHAVDDERCAKAGAEPEKQHAPAAVAADRLHGCIVDQLHRPGELCGEVVADPALAEVVGLGGDAAVIHESRIADGDRVVALSIEQLAQAANHAARCHLGSGFELGSRTMRTDAELHVRTAYIDHQDVPGGGGARDFPFGSHRTILPVFLDDDYRASAVTRGKSTWFCGRERLRSLPWASSA